MDTVAVIRIVAIALCVCFAVAALKLVRRADAGADAGDGFFGGYLLGTSILFALAAIAPWQA